MFEKTDLEGLWFDGEYYSKEEFECDANITDDEIKEIEKDLGFKLPESYIYLMKKHNGGILSKNCVRRKKGGRFSDIEGIYGLGRGKRCSIYEINKDKEYYEEYLIAICSSISGHVQVYLDYSNCEKTEEPEVIAIDDEMMMDTVNPKPIKLADNFEAFINSLYEYNEDEDEDEDEVVESIARFKPDDEIHKLVKKKILIDYSKGMYLLMLAALALIVIGFCLNIAILRVLAVLLIFLEVFLILGFAALGNDILKRKYDCWYDEIAEIEEVDGLKKYKLKETELKKMAFIIGKNETVNVGDVFLCMSEGYAFKYDRSTY